MMVIESNHAMQYPTPAVVVVGRIETHDDDIVAVVDSYRIGQYGAQERIVMRLSPYYYIYYIHTHMQLLVVQLEFCCRFC